MLIDAQGEGCPKPVMMVEEALSGIGDGIVEVLVDNETSSANLTWFAQKNGFFSETSQENGHWRVKIAKGFSCEMPGEPGMQDRKEDVAAGIKESEKDLFLVVGTDTMGKDEELGKILIKGLFETMKVYRELPHTMFFVNTGVRLTTVNEETVPLLREMVAMGVEIFSCGTCLKYFDLESELKVGFRGGTTNILEGMKDFKKMTWIG